MKVLYSAIVCVTLNILAYAVFKSAKWFTVLKALKNK